MRQSPAPALSVASASDVMGLLRETALCGRSESYVRLWDAVGVVEDEAEMQAEVIVLGVAGLGGKRSAAQLHRSPGQRHQVGGQQVPDFVGEEGRVPPVAAPDNDRNPGQQSDPMLVRLPALIGP